MLYPFYYEVYKDPDYKEFSHCVVTIARFSMRHYDPSWICDERSFPKDSHTLVPDVDLSKQTVIFDTCEEGLAFVQEWWKTQ